MDWSTWGIICPGSPLSVTSTYGSYRRQLVVKRLSQLHVSETNRHERSMHLKTAGCYHCNFLRPVHPNPFSFEYTPFNYELATENSALQIRVFLKKAVFVFPCELQKMELSFFVTVFLVDRKSEKSVRVFKCERANKIQRR